MRVWWCEEHECSGYIHESIVLVDGRVTEREEGRSCWAFQLALTDYSEFASGDRGDLYPTECRMVEAVLTRRDTEPETLDRNKLGGW